jgi:S-adenosylmethionine synthetase
VSIGIDADGFAWHLSLGQQSADIAHGVDQALEARSGGSLDPYDTLGAGDQGIMFGFATTETESYMPMPLWLAHRLAQQLATARKTGAVPYLRPDGKTQVTIGFEDGTPVELTTVVISTQHDPGVAHEQIEADLKKHVIGPVLELVQLDVSNTRYLINPSGPFVTGGPDGDAGLTGRKIIVDTYGGASRHGGGAFSGKDPTKVDRSAAYALRWVAKNVVAAGLADKAEIQVSYAIGTAHPVSIFVETFGTEKVPADTIEKAINEVFDLRPKAIIEQLELLDTPFLPTAAYGHFGRTDHDFPWERLNRVKELRQASGL